MQLLSFNLAAVLAGLAAATTREEGEQVTKIPGPKPTKLPPRDNGVHFVQVSNSTNTTSGVGQVSAAGNLSPFGDIGVGCGINWEREVSYGGGLNAGSRAYGLGGGFKITPENITIGLGIGINPANASANVQFSGTTTGHFELVLETSGELSCVPGTKDGKSVLTCKSAPKEHKATRG